MSIAELIQTLTGDQSAEQISALTPEQIAQYRSELAAFVAATPDALTAEHVAQMQAAADLIDSLNAEVTTREETAKTAADLKARVEAATAPAPEKPVEEPKVEVAPEPEAPKVETPAPAPEPAPVPVAAAASTVTPGDLPQDAPPRAKRAFALVASAADRDTPAGEPLAPTEAARILEQKIQRTAQGYKGEREQIPVFTYDYRANFPEDRVLDPSDVIGNSKKMAAVVAAAMNNDPDPIVAAGGICAPLTPDYSFLRVSTDARPIRDSLRAFRAVRGGIRFNDPIPFTDYAGAVDVWTVAEDAAAVTDAGIRKPCLRVDCGDETEVRIEAITRCLMFGNLGARSYPELVADAMAKSMDYHARTAENELLRQMIANSTAQAFGPVFGAARDILFGLAQYTEQFRYTHRVPGDMTMQAWAPRWVRTMMQLDLMRQAPGDVTLDTTGAEIDGYLRNYNIDMTWYLDGWSPDRWEPFAAGTTDTFPNPVRILVAHPGAHVFLDQGTLDLGIVRDSTLNARNDYQVFNETFEGLATPGFDPAYITFTVCPDGSSSLPIDGPSCGTTSGS